MAVTRPKRLESNLPIGRAKLVWLRRLNASALSWITVRSVIFVSFCKEKSMFQKREQLVGLPWPSCNSSILQSSRNPSERVSTDDEKGGAIRRRDAMFPRWGQYRESCSAKLPSQVMKITRTVWWPVGKQTT